MPKKALVRTEKRLPGKQKRHIRRYKSGVRAIINADNVTRDIIKPLPKVKKLADIKPRPQGITLRPAKPKSMLKPRQAKEFTLTVEDLQRLITNSEGFQDIFDGYQFVNLHKDDFMFSLLQELQGRGLTKFTSQKEFDDMKEDILEEIEGIFESFGGKDELWIYSYGNRSDLFGLEQIVFDEVGSENAISYYHDPFDGRLMKFDKDDDSVGPSELFKVIYESEQWAHPDEMGLVTNDDDRKILSVGNELQNQKVPFLFLVGAYDSAIWVPKSQYSKAVKVLNSLEKVGKQKKR